VSTANSKSALVAAVRYLKSDPWLKDASAGADARRANLMHQAGVAVVEDNNGVPVLSYTGTDANSVIALAIGGDAVAHQALCLVAARLTAKKETLPLALQQYVVGAASQLKRGKKGNPAVNALRDDAIFDAIEIVIKLGFKPTRNRASKHESACSIVAKALADCRAALSEGEVETIWQNRRRAWEKAGISR
jgi:hypothetical protein